MRLFVTWDTHGNACSEFEKLNSINFPAGKSLTSDDIVVILGDFGLLFKPDLTREEFYWLNWLSEKPWTTLFIDGNHENFERLNTLPESSKWWGKVWVVDLSLDNFKMKKPIYHLKRGQVFEINGKKIFTMGGALSIDKVYRTPYISWWPQEDVNYAEMEEAYNNLEKVNNKVDFIFTHTCPNNEIDTIFPGKFQTKFDDTTGKFLSVIKGSVEFKHWYFGHFHSNKTVNKFTCTYSSLVEVPMNSDLDSDSV